MFKNERHANRRRTRQKNGLKCNSVTSSLSSPSRCPGLICYPDTQMADEPVSISHDSPVLPTKDYYKNNTEKAAFRKRLFLIYASGCMSVPVAFLLKLTLKEQGIALEWEQGTKLSGMFGDSTVKGRKRLGSTHYC